MAGCGPVPAGTSAHLHRQADVEYSLRWLHVTHGIGLQLGCAQASQPPPSQSAPGSAPCAVGGLAGGGICVSAMGGLLAPTAPFGKGGFLSRDCCLAPSRSFGWLLPGGPCIGPPSYGRGCCTPRPVAILGLRSLIPPRWGLWPRLGIFFNLYVVGFSLGYGRRRG